MQASAPRRRLTISLLTWYRKHQRPLPWRRTRDAYAIWVSEVMLQQTQVATVIAYYERWMRLFPKIEDLARASEDQVLHAWQGLGYYSRARRLREGARYLAERYGKRLPRNPEAWLEVPGVGRYTAGAVTSIAFDAMTPVVDGNVTRVLCRLHALSGDPLKAPLSKELWRLAADLLAPESPGDVNQALMELGATVCTPKQPRCSDCPWQRACLAHARGRVLEYPMLSKRQKATAVRMVSGVVHHRGRVLLVQQPENAKRWASMWLFPTAELTAESEPAQGLTMALKRLGMTAHVGEKRARFAHTVTRYRITLDVYDCKLASKETRPPGTRVAWCSPPQLASYALPAVHRKIAEHLLRKRVQPGQ